MSDVKNKKELPVYGTPGYEFELRWHDEAQRDDLIVVDAIPFADVMKARAKGTTIYEMIDQFGGIDNLTECFSIKEKDAVYADVSDYPEFANDAEYGSILAKLQKQIDALKIKQDSVKKEADIKVENVEALEGDK